MHAKRTELLEPTLSDALCVVADQLEARIAAVEKLKSKPEDLIMPDESDDAECTGHVEVLLREV